MINKEICKICSSESVYLFTEKILNKYQTKYFQCEKCKFIQTENPFWLDEAYADAINYSDIGYIYRNINNSKITKFIINNFFESDKKYLDVGGGYGVFTRIMRDFGYDFYNYDPFCKSLFSSNFNLDKKEINENKFEIVTFFEVLEHVAEPISFLQEMFKLSDNILFTTELCDETKKYISANDWWYFDPYNGQHISFYSLNSLKTIAKTFNCNLFSENGFHLMTKNNVNNMKYKLIMTNFYSIINSLKKPRKSLLITDYNSIINKKIE